MFDPQHKTHKPISNNGTKFLSYGVVNFNTQTSKNTNFVKNSNKDIKFNNNMVDTDANSGMCSPPLWSTSPTKRQQLSPQRLRENYRNMSPESKAEAVARGQKELMEMVKNMPESCYELTLKDLVEQQQKSVEENQQKGVEDGVGSLKKVKSFERKNVVRMNENGGGYLLKMGFPIGSKKTEVGAGRKKIKNSGTKVSPRISVDGSGNGRKSNIDKEKEWWKIGFLSESGRSGSKSSSTGSSNSSGSRSSQRKNIETYSCWSFLWTKRSAKEE